MRRNGTPTAIALLKCVDCKVHEGTSCVSSHVMNELIGCKGGGAGPLKEVTNGYHDTE